MSAITITISSPGRAIVAEGRLVAGETAEVSIEGATPTALYLVAPDQTVVAACEAFTPGQGMGGVGFLQLATEQIAALFANTPAGRMIAVWALINGADGVAGAGWVPVLSAPMPDELVDLDIDFYLRASQVGAGLAIVDGKLVCTVNPATYLTKAEAAATYATQTALAGKQDTISDLATIRSGAAAGATAYQKPASGIPATDLAEAVQTSLGKADTALQTAPVQSVNGKTGAVVLTASDVEAAPAADLRYALPAALLDPDPQTGAYQLDDRAVNSIVTSAPSIELTFPPETTGRARDFLVRIDSLASGSGNITITLTDSSNILLYTPSGDWPDIPIGKTTILYFSEIEWSTYLFKAETVEGLMPTQGGN